MFDFKRVLSLQEPQIETAYASKRRGGLSRKLIHSWDELGASYWDRQMS